MGNINYSKAEKEVEKAVQNTTVKSLVEGKTVKSTRTMEYYGIKEDTPRPRPEDRVQRFISEVAAQEEGLEKAETAQKEDLEGEEEEEFEIVTKIPEEDILKKARKQSARTPKHVRPKSQTVAPSDNFLEPSAPLLILRKHILWFKRLHMDDRYEKLGTTREEVFALRKARRLSDKELERVNELNKRSEELKKEILKKNGKESLDEIVEKETIRHKRKRLKTRESWIPL